MTPATTIEEFEAQHREWAKANFPDATAEDAWLGMVEEIGELAHALLKRRQGIKGMDDDVNFKAAVLDACADAAIFCVHHQELERRVTDWEAGAYRETDDVWIIEAMLDVLSTRAWPMNNIISLLDELTRRYCDQNIQEAVLKTWNETVSKRSFR